MFAVVTMCPHRHDRCYGAQMKLYYGLFSVLMASHAVCGAQQGTQPAYASDPVAAPRLQDSQTGLRSRAPAAIPVAPREGGASVTEPIDTRLGGRAEPISSGDKTTFSSLTPDMRQSTPVVGIGSDYLVGPNDLLDIEVFDMENLKRTVRVNAAGAISLPLIGGVVVAGLTAEKVEELIAQRYSEKYLQNPQVSVFIKEFTTQRITVEGAVQKPGIYPLTGQITLLRALALAGGAGQIANMGEVIVFRTSERGVRQAAVFDVDNIRSGKGEDPLIKGDDLIVVQRDNSRRILKDSLFRDIIDSINPFSVFARP